MIASKITSIGLTLFSALALTMAIAPNIFAQTTQLLGQTRLSFRKNDLRILNLPRCQQPPIGAIRLRAIRGSAELNTLVVRYGNNVTERLPVRSRLNEGRETNWINLRGTRRCLTGIAIVGNTTNSNVQTIIRFFGR
jgi:hypothetical protein